LKLISFVIFFSIVFSIYSVGNYYVYTRASQAWPFNGWPRTLFNIAFFILWISFIVSRFTGNTELYNTHYLLSWIGSFWLISILYFLIIVLFFDLLRLSNLWFHFLPKPNTLKHFELKTLALSISFFVVVVVILAGHLNAIKTRITEVDIVSDKPLKGRSELTLVSVSDIHMGVLIGKERIQKMVDTINQMKPDIIILAGDILEEGQAPIFKFDIGSPLKELKAPLGVYAIPGNHEYIGGIKTAKQYITSLNINWLQDTVVSPDTSFYLIGRNDRQDNAHRKSLKDLLVGIDSSKYTILLDHQPHNLKEAFDNHIDFQISGHTHSGQFWPFTHLINSIYELSHGYLKKGNTNYYVSSGFGTWGPPVRICTTPEIVVIRVKSMSK